MADPDKAELQIRFVNMELQLDEMKKERDEMKKEIFKIFEFFEKEVLKYFNELFNQ